MPVPDRLLPRAGLVDRLQRQSYFDELLLGDHRIPLTRVRTPRCNVVSLGTTNSQVVAVSINIPLTIRRFFFVFSRLPARPTTGTLQRNLALPAKLVKENLHPSSAQLWENLMELRERTARATLPKVLEQQLFVRLFIQPLA